jgi:hypothetical protein
MTSCVAAENAPEIRRDQRPPLGDLAREQGAALGRPQRRVRLVHPERRQHLGERVAVPRRVLAHVEPREVEAEHLDLPDRVVELRGGDELRARVAQQPLGEPEVAEQLAGAP